jgi:hypothetical protein
MFGSLRCFVWSPGYETATEQLMTTFQLKVETISYNLAAGLVMRTDVDGVLRNARS